jgi:transcriptional regulator with PAS, ATPase and Fis domain
LPDTLLESELFGYRRGAFTGATADKPGRFAMAGSGTLFLDEIGDISPALQVRLLRVLQEHTYEPLGSTVSERTDARIIAATNRDLKALVEANAFRQDLFYRLNVIRIDLPPLRARKEDIPLLAEHFVARFNRLQQRRIEGVSPEVLSLLLAHDWPGNVRELENVIEHAFVLCTGERIEVRHLPPEFAGAHPRENAPAGLEAASRAAEAQLIRAALKRNRYNRSATARELGIHPSTLYRKMIAFGIPFPKQDGRSRKRPGS